MKAIEIIEDKFMDNREKRRAARKVTRGKLQAMVNGGVLMPLSRVTKIDLLHAEKIPTGISELDDLLRGGIYRRSVAIVCGESHEGKSGLVCQIIAKTLANTDKYVLAYSREMSDGELIYKTLIQLAGEEMELIPKTMDYGIPASVERDIRKLVNERYFSVSTKDADGCQIRPGERWAHISKTFEDFAKATNGNCLIIVDPLMMLTADTACSPGMPQSEVERQTMLASWLENFASQYRCWILMAAHYKKKTGNALMDKDPQERILGASATFNASGTVITYSRYNNADFNWIRKHPEQALKSRRFNGIVKKEIGDIGPLPTDEKEKAAKLGEYAERLISLLEDARNITVYKNRGNRGKQERVGFCAGFNQKTERIGSYGRGDFDDSKYNWRANLSDAVDLADPIDPETGMTLSEIQRRIDEVLMPAFKDGDKSVDPELTRLMETAQWMTTYAESKYES